MDFPPVVSSSCILSFSFWRVRFSLPSHFPSPNTVAEVYRFCPRIHGTLVYRIDVHACLLILREKSTLYGLILDCTFIDFVEKFPPVRLFHPARLLILVIHQQSLEFMVTFWGKTSIFHKGKTSIFHKFKPLDSHESAVFFKIYLFFYSKV